MSQGTFEEGQAFFLGLAATLQVSGGHTGGAQAGDGGAAAGAPHGPLLQPAAVSALGKRRASRRAPPEAVDQRAGVHRISAEAPFHHPLPAADGAFVGHAGALPCSGRGRS